MIKRNVVEVIVFHTFLCNHKAELKGCIIVYDENVTAPNRIFSDRQYAVHSYIDTHLKRPVHLRKNTEGGPQVGSVLSAVLKTNMRYCSGMYILVCDL